LATRPVCKGRSPKLRSNLSLLCPIQGQVTMRFCPTGCTDHRMCPFSTAATSRAYLKPPPNKHLFRWKPQTVYRVLRSPPTVRFRRLLAVRAFAKTCAEDGRRSRCRAGKTRAAGTTLLALVCYVVANFPVALFLITQFFFGRPSLRSRKTGQKKNPLFVGYGVGTGPHWAPLARKGPPNHSRARVGKNIVKPHTKRLFLISPVPNHSALPGICA